MLPEVPAAPCMVRRAHPEVVMPKSCTFTAVRGSVTATGFLVAVFWMGGIDCARSTPVGAGTVTAAVHVFGSKPGEAHPDWTSRASYVSDWTLSAVVGPSAVTQLGALTTR